jgi:hypothetical protein
MSKKRRPLSNDLTDQGKWQLAYGTVRVLEFVCWRMKHLWGRRLTQPWPNHTQEGTMSRMHLVDPDAPTHTMCKTKIPTGQDAGIHVSRGRDAKSRDIRSNRTPDMGAVEGRCQQCFRNKGGAA